MALDSKDSDIEQLRSLLNSLNVQSLDSASMSSGPDMDTDESLQGTGKSFSKLFILFSFFITFPFYSLSLCFLHVVPCHPCFFLHSFGLVLISAFDLSPFTSLQSLTLQVICMAFGAWPFDLLKLAWTLCFPLTDFSLM